MTATPVKTIPTKTGLRTGALGFPALLAQSVALISPTMTAVLIIPLAFSSAGQGTWLAYLFGTVMLLFVVLCLNQFAKRSAAPGAMYTYTARGLGPATGVVSGWTLLWCYLFIGTAGLTGFAIFCQQFLDALGATVTVPPDHLLRDQRPGLLVHRLQGHPHIVAGHAGLRGHLGHAHPGAGRRRAVQARLHVDTDQLKLKGVGLHGMSLAVVACIFSLVGFESATALGGEAKNPLRNVPRAVIWSLIITGTVHGHHGIRRGLRHPALRHPARLHHRAAHRAVQPLPGDVLQGPDRARRHDQLLLALPVLPQRGRADPLPHGRARRLPPPARPGAPEERHPARRAHRLHHDHARRSRWSSSSSPTR